jgi:hypothetical protein
VHGDDEPGAGRELPPEVQSSTSQSTGIAPACTTAPTVATQKKLGTTTSHPGPIPRAVIAVIRAPVPLLTASACRAP